MGKKWQRTRRQILEFRASNPPTQTELQNRVMSGLATIHPEPTPQRMLYAQTLHPMCERMPGRTWSDESATLLCVAGKNQEQSRG